MHTYYVPGTVLGSRNITVHQAGIVPAPLSLGVWGDRWKQRHTQVLADGNAASTERRCRLRHGVKSCPELSSEGRARNSFLDRGTGPCKSQEVGRDGNVEKQAELGGEREPGQAR